MATPEYLRVVATADHEARWYVGHVGAVVHVTPAAPKLGLEALVILEFANGMRDVFRAYEVAPACEGDAPSPEAKPLSGARKQRTRAQEREAKKTCA